MKRLLASVEIAARSIGAGDKERRKIATDVAKAYRTAMRDFAARPNIDVWYARLDVDDFLREHGGSLGKAQSKTTQSTVKKARSRDHLRSVEKLTRAGGRASAVRVRPAAGARRWSELLGDAGAGLPRRAWASWCTPTRRRLQPDRRHLVGQYRLVDMARKVVGVGSVGTRAWILLLEGADDGDHLILQAKEAQSSVLEQFLGASEYTQSGQRVVEGQRLMQAASDAMLGWQRTRGIDGVERDFYIRQLRDWKGSAVIEDDASGGLQPVRRSCARGPWPARTHGRATGWPSRPTSAGRRRPTRRSPTTPRRTPTGTQSDHAELVAAIGSGRLAAVHGV